MAARIDELLASYSAKAQPVLGQLQVGGFNDAPVANKAMDPAKRHAHDAEAQLDALLAVLEAETSASNEARGTATTAAYWVFALALASAVLLVVPLTLINMRSICTARGRSRGTGPAHCHRRPEQRHRYLGRRRDGTSDAIAGGDAGLAAPPGGRVRAVPPTASRMASAEIATGNQDLSQPHRAGRQQPAADRQLDGAAHRHRRARHADAARQANQLASTRGRGRHSAAARSCSRW